tara:strand:+ start:139 stop:489 length:351 start_codon:yes stop_codon:yes gene_type:complete
MATFPSINPSFGFTKLNEPNVRVVKLGDGYQHRIILGLPDNQNGKKFQFEFKDIDESDSDTIETFLDERITDLASFDFQAPTESASKKYICLKWSKRVNYAGKATISATFEEVFEP